MTVGTIAVPRRNVPAPLERVPPVSNARLAMVILIMAESMLFTGLVGMYLVFRLSAREWPPPGLPRLPLGLTAFNTVLLLGSILPLVRARAAFGRNDDRAAVRGLLITTGLGSVFLLVQGLEWARLVRYGLTLGSGSYASAFYGLIGCHAVHVMAAVTWLAAVTLLAARGRFSATQQTGVEMCALYWYFVCGLWAFLFPLVYLY